MASLDWLGNDAAQIIRRSVSWWLGELTALVPQRFLGRIDAAPAVLDVSRSGAVLSLTSRGAKQPERIPIDGEDQAVKAHVRSVMRRWLSHSVMIRFDPSLLFETTATLPAAAEHSLRQILLHQLDRLVPLPADQVEFEYLVEPYEVGAKTITVRLIVTMRESIERAIAIANGLGLTPRLIVAASQGAKNNYVTLWRASQSNSGSRFERWLRRGLEVTALVLLVVAYGSYVYRLDQTRADLQGQVAQVGKAAMSVRDLVQQITDGETAIAILQKRQQTSNYLGMLNALTELVPDDTWVSQLSVRGTNVEIIGFSPRVADLVARLEASDSVDNPRFRAPITRSADGATERFDLSFDMSLGEQN